MGSSDASSSLEVKEDVEGRSWIVGPAALVEVGDYERCEVVVEFGNADNIFECGTDAGYMVDLGGLRQWCRSVFSAAFVCPPFLVKVSDGDLAAVKFLK